MAVVAFVDWCRARTRSGNEDGQTVIEYALAVGLASVVVLGVLALAANGWINAATSAAKDAI